MICETFSQDPAARTFHYHPYEQTYHSPLDPSRPAERVYDEVFSSDAWLREDAKIQMARIDPSKPEPHLPRVIAAMMFWSDETVLNQFGQNKAWPVYFFFGNQPKSERAKPTAGGGRHLAYLPQVTLYLIISVRVLDRFNSFLIGSKKRSGTPRVRPLRKRSLLIVGGKISRQLG